MPEKEYTPTEVCKKVGISKNTLFRWEREGIISGAKRDWKGWRVFSEEDVQDVLRAKNSKTEAINQRKSDEK